MKSNGQGLVEYAIILVLVTVVVVACVAFVLFPIFMPWLINVVWPWFVEVVGRAMSGDLAAVATLIVLGLLAIVLLRGLRGD